MKAVLLSSLSLFLLLPACGKSGGVTGTWVLDTAQMKQKIQESMKQAETKNPKGAAMMKAMMQAMIASFDKMKASIEINGDGTFSITAQSPGKKAPEAGKGTWKLEKDVLTLTPTSGKAFGKGNSPKKFRFTGSTIVPFEDQGGKGGPVMVFRKQ